MLDSKLEGEDKDLFAWNLPLYFKDAYVTERQKDGLEQL